MEKINTPIGDFQTFTANNVVFVPKGNDDNDDIWLSWEEFRLMVQQLQSFLKLKPFISCPFCKEDDFDILGLKYHLNGHCTEVAK